MSRRLCWRAPRTEMCVMAMEKFRLSPISIRNKIAGDSLEAIRVEGSDRPPHHDIRWVRN